MYVEREPSLKLQDRLEFERCMVCDYRARGEV